MLKLGFETLSNKVIKDEKDQLVNDAYDMLVACSLEGMERSKLLEMEHDIQEASEGINNLLEVAECIRTHKYTKSLETYIGETFAKHGITPSVEGVMSKVGQGIKDFFAMLWKWIKDSYNWFINLFKKDKTEDKIERLKKELKQLQAGSSEGILTNIIRGSSDKVNTFLVNKLIETNKSKIPTIDSCIIVSDFAKEKMPQLLRMIQESKELISAIKSLSLNDLANREKMDKLISIFKEKSSSTLNEMTRLSNEIAVIDKDSMVDKPLAESGWDDISKLDKLKSNLHNILPIVEKNFAELNEEMKFIENILVTLEKIQVAIEKKNMQVEIHKILRIVQFATKIMNSIVKYNLLASKNVDLILNAISRKTAEAKANA